MAHEHPWVLWEEHDPGRRAQHGEVLIRQTDVASEDSPADRCSAFLLPYHLDRLLSPQTLLGGLLPSVVDRDAEQGG